MKIKIRDIYNFIGVFLLCALYFFETPISLLGTQLINSVANWYYFMLYNGCISAWENKLFEKSLSIHTDVDNDDSVFFCMDFYIVKKWLVFVYFLESLFVYFLQHKTTG